MLLHMVNVKNYNSFELMTFILFHFYLHKPNIMVGGAGSSSEGAIVSLKGTESTSGVVERIIGQFNNLPTDEESRNKANIFGGVMLDVTSGLALSDESKSSIVSFANFLASNGLHEILKLEKISNEEIDILIIKFTESLKRKSVKLYVEQEFAKSVKEISKIYNENESDISIIIGRSLQLASRVGITNLMTILRVIIASLEFVYSAEEVHKVFTDKTLRFGYDDQETKDMIASVTKSAGNILRSMNNIIPGLNKSIDGLIKLIQTDESASLLGDEIIHLKTLGLDISERPTKEAINTAYRKKAVLLHPDKNKGDIEATKKFQELGEARSWFLTRLQDGGSAKKRSIKKTRKDTLRHINYENLISLDRNPHLRSCGINRHKTLSRIIKKLSQFTRKSYY